MKDTPHKSVDDPAPEQTLKAADLSFLGRIRTALFRRRGEEKKNPKHPILGGLPSFDRAQKEEGQKPSLTHAEIPGKEAMKDTLHKTVDGRAPERTHTAMDRPPRFIGDGRYASLDCRPSELAPACPCHTVATR